MSDMIEDDEREAREWFNRFLWGEEFHKTKDAKHARTILALLDRPVMPKPEDVPDEVLRKMVLAWQVIGTPHAIYRALYDHYTAPPAPRKHERWLVVCADGTEHGAWRTRERALDMASDQPGSRIVRLVEADHD